MDKYDYITAIIEFARGRTGTSFQLCIRDILQTYYDYKDKKFEMPSSYGGDDKNDGWVKEDAIFYQIYSPIGYKGSFKKDIENKFEEDLIGLLNHIQNGKWSGNINEFIFIVNTFDNNLPHDSENFFGNLVEELKTIYSMNFTYKRENIDYLYDLLVEIDDVKRLESLSAKLRIRHFINPQLITEKMMIELILDIAGNINHQYLGENKNGNYQRVSTPLKISINGLEDRRERIEKIMVNLDMVEEAVNTINQDIMTEDKFEKVKNFIIDKYNKLSKQYVAIELYDKIIDSILELVDNKKAYSVPTEFLIVYIFDKCDIFEKERSEGNDITK